MTTTNDATRDGMTTPAAAGPFPRLAGLWRDWRRRRAFLALADMPAWQLDALGLTSREVAWGATLPLSTNAAVAVRERADTRRHDELAALRARSRRRAAAPASAPRARGAVPASGAARDAAPLQPVRMLPLEIVRRRATDDAGPAAYAEGLGAAFLGVHRIGGTDRPAA